MKLEEYNKKRDFLATNEPKGKISGKNEKLKFVIQYHKARAKHYDFRLEWKGVLMSWAVPKGLSLDPTQKRLAVHVEDHPLDYASFEGIIPKGNYGAGSVDIFDEGYYEPSFDIDYGLKKGHLKFSLFGKVYRGEWSLVKIDEKNWLLIKSQDKYAKKEAENSKKSTKCALKPESTDVMLAKLADKIPTDKDWLFEIKYDGYRLLSFVQNGKAICLTRGKQDYTSKFSNIAKSLQQIDEQTFVVDGEVVAFDEKGRSDFGLLQKRIKEGGDKTYVIFDLLELNGKDLRGEPLIERKKLLKRLFSKERPHLCFGEHIVGNGEKVFEFARKNGLEGIVAKNAESAYSGSRNGDWLKIKCYARQEFVICGYCQTDKNLILSALVLGYYKDGKLIFAGKVGTGFDEKGRQTLAQKLAKIQLKTCPIDVFPPKSKIEAVWTKPKLVAEIQFAEFTKDGVLRQPSYVGLRQDKDAKDVKLEIADEK